VSRTVISIIGAIVVAALAFTGGVVVGAGYGAGPLAGLAAGLPGAGAGSQGARGFQRGGFRGFGQGMPPGAVPPGMGQPGDGQRGAPGTDSGLVAGRVLSADRQSMTVQLAGGGSKTVYFTDTTRFSEVASGTAADVSAGATVTAGGDAQADGSISARFVTIAK
jgi:hypothetical protein